MTQFDYDFKAANDDGRKALVNARDQLASAINEINYYIRRYEEVADSVEPKKMAEQLNAAINHCSGNILGNLRIDRLADAQASLMRLAPKPAVFSSEEARK